MLFRSEIVHGDDGHKELMPKARLLQIIKLQRVRVGSAGYWFLREWEGMLYSCTAKNIKEKGGPLVLCYRQEVSWLCAGADS